jgi:hypothetical protein
MDTADLKKQAQAVLQSNDQHGMYTIPAHGIYPHQWLWDSCFIAIGISNYNVGRAKQEVLSLLRGQWSNGMIPHMIFSEHEGGSQDQLMWRSWMNPYAPKDINTTGITQPPVIAETVVRIGKKLPLPERRSWYQTVFPALIAYHQWLYAERDPHNEGLALQIHPWETGLDNTPPWMQELHNNQLSWWIRLISWLKFQSLFTLIRRDIRFVPANQRLSTLDALALYSIQRRLRGKSYDINKILTPKVFAIEDLTFNSIFVRANTHLKAIAKTIGKQLPEELLASMKKSEQALNRLWDESSSQYYSKNFTTGELIKISTIASLMPLYSGCISKEKAKQLVDHLENTAEFGAKFSIPSAPLNSDWFHEFAYWQGPTWVNTNWLIIDGLRRYGYKDLANKIAASTVEMVNKAGFYEYFSPLSGEPAGIENFSWTAALTLDLLSK